MHTKLIDRSKNARTVWRSDLRARGASDALARGLWRGHRRPSVCLQPDLAPPLVARLPAQSCTILAGPPTGRAAVSLHEVHLRLFVGSRRSVPLFNSLG